MQITLCNDNLAAWDAYINSHPEASNYHQSGWKKVVEHSFGHSSFYLCAVDKQERVRGVLPLVLMKSRLFGTFLISLPFFNYGGLLCDNEEIEAGLIHKAREIISETGAEYAEFRHVDNHGARLPGKRHKVSMILTLQQDLDEQWKAFNTKLRNQIRKAEKSGLTVVIGGIELLDQFYDVFCRNMRDLGTPVYGKDFFHNVLTEFPQSSRIIAVFLEGKAIAAGITSSFRDTIEVPWASSIRDYKAFCPNNLLYWAAIRFAIENGFRKFDFGRSTPHEGTYRFKEQWGARPLQLYWHYLMRNNATLPQLNTKNSKYQAAIRIWQRLPVAVTRIIGPLIVKNIP